VVRFATVLNERMREKGMSIRELAGLVGVTYEHARRLSRGLSVPSRYMCRVICEALDLNFAEVYPGVVKDSVERRYGKSVKPEEIDGHVDPVHKLWGRLTPSQQRDFFTQMESLADRNNKERRSA